MEIIVLQTAVYLHKVKKKLNQFEIVILTLSIGNCVGTSWSNYKKRSNKVAQNDFILLHTYMPKAKESQKYSSSVK